MSFRKTSTAQKRKRKFTSRKLFLEQMEDRRLLIAQPVGDEFLVNQWFYGEQETTPGGMSVDAAANGDAVVVFNGRGPGNQQGVFGRRLDASGRALGEQFTLSRTRFGWQDNATVSVADNGDFVVAWSGLGLWDLAGVFARRFNADGTPVTGEIQVNQTWFGIQREPAVAIKPDGSFVVAWEGRGAGDSSGVFVRQFNSQGIATSAETRVNTTTRAAQREATIDVAADGSFVIAWSGEGAGDSNGVFLRRFDTWGHPLGSEIPVNSITRGQQTSPSIAVGGKGDIIVAWERRGFGDDKGIFMQRFSATGSPIGNATLVNTTTGRTQSDPVVAATASGSFVVTWSSSKRAGHDRVVVAQQFDAAGGKVGDEQIVNTTTKGSQQSSSVAVRDNGDFLVTWSGRGVGDNAGVFARRFVEESGTDTTPPTITVGLANDTGTSSSDRVTSDPTVAGSVVDESPLASFTLTIPELSVGPIGMLNEIDPDDGSYALTRATLEAAIGATLIDGNYTVRLQATDQHGNTSAFSEIAFELDTVNSTPAILSITEDTGGMANDGVTNDNTLLFSGSADAASVVVLREITLGVVGSTTTNATGNWTIDASHILLNHGSYSFIATASDAAGNISSDSATFGVTVDQLAPAAPTGLDLVAASDTGTSDTDNVTADSTPTFSVDAESGSLVKLFADGVLVGEGIANSVVEITASELVEGVYGFTAIATDLAGNVSTLSTSLQVEIRTRVQTAPAFDLTAASDSVPVGDQATTFEIVALAGQTDPNLSVEILELNQRTTADGSGAFTLLGVPLRFGANTFTLKASDLAGNTAQFSRTITRSPAADGIVLAEGDQFVTEHSETVALGQLLGTRTIRFDLATDFDTTASGAALEDAFLVYLVDANDPTQTLLDRGTNGTALFMLAGDRVEITPGIVRFDGTTVEIDVTSLGDLNEGRLVFQLLGGDNDNGTQIEITNLTNTLDQLGLEAGAFPVDDYLASRGDSVDLADFTESADLQPLLSNVRFDSAIGRYTAELRIMNHGEAIGRRAMIAFPGLPAGVALLDPSGTTPSGVPYVNMQNTIQSGGLMHGSASDGIQIELDNAQSLRFALTPQVLVGPLNQAPSLAPIDAVTIVPGEVFDIALDIADPDGDRLTTSITSAQGILPAGQLAGSVLRFSPTPNDVGTYDLTVTVSDGVLQSQQSFQLTVAEDTDQVTRISGVVLDTDGTPLAGVPVSLSRMVTMTDVNGRFEIRLPSTLIPTESFDLEVPVGDPYFDPFGTGTETIDFRRARFNLSTGTDTDNPRLHPNLVSSFLDASSVYGSDDTRALALRTGSGGRLKVSSGPDCDLLPLNNATYFPDGPLEIDSAGTVDPSTLFVAGDVRASENPALSTLHILFVREHNRQADSLAAANPSLTDEQVYQLARGKVIALLQHITYQEYLPVLLGSGAIPDYTGYDANVEPEVGAFFTTAAFRIGHSQMVSQLLRLDASGNESAGGHLSLREAFFTSEPVKNEGIDTLVRGLLAQPAQATDLQVVDDLRNFLFGPPGSGGMDLPAMTVQRGREMGLPSYAQARLDFGLPAVNDFADVTSNVTVQNMLQNLYGTVDKIDPFVGGLAEDPVGRGLVGPLFHAAIAEQFRVARDGDRFWYENSQFTQSELDEIRATTLADLIVRNTGVTGLSGNLFTSGAASNGPNAGGAAVSAPTTEHRSLDGFGNNTTNPQAGSAGSNLRIDASLNYADGISEPNGGDRPSARAVSNAAFAQSGSVVDATGFNALGIFWGQFLSHDLALTPTGTSDTLKIHGDGLNVPDKAYPFVAEKLHLLLERDIYENAANEISRPIYLPAIDTANAVTVDPAQTTTVTTAAIPSAELTIAANSLESRDGQPYTGQISITEVPRNFTPAALPANSLPDIVVTIQPAEMVFTTPAPLTLPNRAGYAIDGLFDLMSINPVTGDFDIVGTGRATGDQIVTIERGVRNSSWHFFRPRPPEIAVDPSDLPENELNGCGCECPTCKATVEVASRVELHSGSYIEYHELVGYQSQGQTRSWQLTYDSNRVTPQPIVQFGYSNVQSAANRRLGASVSWRPVGGSFDQAVEFGSVGGSSTAPSFQHYWSIPADGNFEAALQVDMRQAPSGHYNVELKSGLVQYVDGQAFGVSNSALVPVEIVNTTNSVFGAGWGLDGLTELVLNPDGSILMIDGNGSELLFTASGAGTFTSPPGDFSTLERVDEGSGSVYRRTFKDQTVDRYRSLAAPSSRGTPQRVAQLETTTDRNGNETRFEYDAQNRLSRIIDPVGLATVLNYAGGKVASIVDPAGRATELDYDVAGNLIRIGDPDNTSRQFEYNQDHKQTAELTKRAYREQVGYDSFGRVNKTVRRDGTAFQIAPLQTQQVIRYSLTTNHDSPPPAREGLRAAARIYSTNKVDSVTTVRPDTLGAALWVDGSGRMSTSLVDQDAQEILRVDDEGLVASHERSANNQIVRSVSGRGFVTLYEYDDRGNLLSVTDDETLSEPTVEYLFDSGLDTSGGVPESHGGVALGTINYFPDYPWPFVDDEVYGEQRQVYAFEAAQGLSLATTGLISPGSYAIEMVFKFDDVEGRQDLIHFNHRFTGILPLEVIDGQLAFSPSPTLRGGTIVAGEYVHVVVTRAEDTDEFVAYVNGQEVFRFFDTDQYLTTSPTEQFTFFVETNNNGFVSPGKAALIRVYDNPLTPGQVQRLSDSPFQANFSGLDKTVFTYDATFNQRTSMTDQLGRQTLYEVDPNTGNLLSVTQVVGQPDLQSGETDDVVTRYTYLASGLIDTMTDPLGRITAYGYDQFQRLTSITSAVGTSDEALETFEYDAAGNRSAHTDENGNRTEYEYDALNRLLKVTEPDPDGPANPALGTGLLTSPITESVYDAQGNLLQQIDALGNTTSYTYDALDRRTASTDALQQVTRFTYDDSDNVLSVVDRLGRRTEFVYDTRNRLVEVIDRLGFREQLAYDRDDNVIRRTDKNGEVTTYRYSARNLLIQSTDALGGVSRWQYDRANNLVDQSDELRRTMAYEYDELNRLIKTIAPDPDGPLRRQGTVAEYLLQGSLAEESGGTTLDVLGAAGQFATEDVLGANRQVYQFAQGTGLQLSTTDLIPADQYAIELVFRFDNVFGYRRVLDFSGLSSDNGLYVTDGQLRFYSHAASGGSIPAGQYVHLVLTRDASGTMQGYVDGQLVFGTVDVARLGVVNNVGDLLSLFVDDGTEESSGAIALLRLYASPLTADLIQTLAADPFAAESPVSRVTTGQAESPVTQFVYDKASNVLQVIDPLLNVTTNVYDHRDRLIQRIDADPDGSGPLLSPLTTYAYDDGNRLTSISDPLNRVTSFEYDGLDRIIRRVLPDPDQAGPDSSPIISYAYDAMDNRVSMIDPLGNETRYEYDDLYRLARVIEADPDGPMGSATNPISSFAYDAESQLLSSTDPLGRATSYGYDLLGRVIIETHPDPDRNGPLSSPVMQYFYDAVGNRIAIMDAFHNVTEYEYDDLYRLTKIIATDPDGPGPDPNPVTTYVYDAVDQMLSATDPLQRTVSYKYDDLGRVIETTLPDPDQAGPLLAPVMSSTYDAVNNKLSTTDALGNVTQYRYDNLYRLTSVIEEDPDGVGPLDHPVTQFTYDVASQRLTESDPLNRTTAYDYDDLGRVVLVTQPDPDGVGPLEAPQMSYTYDLVNNQLSMTDALGNVTQYEYDKLYRLTKQIDEDLDGAGPRSNPVSSYAFDLVGNLLSLTDPDGNTTAYAYDDLDRRVSETIDLGVEGLKTRLFAFDAMSNLLSTTDRNGRVIEYVYDNLYRNTEERWLDDQSNVVHSIQFDYDIANQMLVAEDATAGSRYDYTYDDLSRVTQTQIHNGGPTVMFEASYNAESLRTELLASVGATADFANAYEYDGLLRLETQTQGGQANGMSIAPKRVDYIYNADDQFAAITRYDGLTTNPADEVVTTTYSYDGIGRLTGLDHTSASTSLHSLGFTFDSAHRITQIDSSVDGVSGFNYDHINQVTSATHNSQSDEAYAYDENGNRTGGAYQTGLYNRLTSDGTYDYKYDAEGNRTKRTDIATGTVTEYEWDHRNRLVRVTARPSDQGPLTSETVHTYDVFNRWIAREVDPDGDGSQSSEATRFYYDGSQIVLQTDASGSVAHRYLWGPSVDQLLADENSLGDVLFPLANHQETVTDLVDATGAIVNHRVYNSFGERASETNAAVDHLFGFTGRPLDETTGLQNNLNRWYDAATGTWPSEDPIGFGGDPSNPYRYVGNSPLQGFDPFGLYDWGRDTRNAGNGGLGIGQGLINRGADAVNGVFGVADSVIGGGAASIEIAGHNIRYWMWGDSNDKAVADEIWNEWFEDSKNDIVDYWSRPVEEREAMLGAGLKEMFRLDHYRDQWNEYQRLLSIGCEEEASRLLGTMIGEAIPEILAAGKVAGNVKKLATDPKFRKMAGDLARNERGSLPLDDAARKHVKSLDNAPNSPPNLSPEGAGRRGAFREAKRNNDIPVGQQPSSVKPNIDRRGRTQPGKQYEFDTPDGKKTIRDDAGGHNYPDDPTQNRGPHFNDDAGNHYDY